MGRIPFTIMVFKQHTGTGEGDADLFGGRRSSLEGR